MSNMEEFARRLKSCRKERGLTQAELAEKIGVVTQTISAYEKSGTGQKGKTPTLDKVIDIAKVLGVSIDYLCDLSDSEQPGNGPETLADVVIMLTEIAKKIPCSGDTKSVPLPPDEWISAENEFGESITIDTKDVAVFVLDNEMLADHFRNMNKVRSLLKAHVIDEDLYNTIIDGQLAKLKIYPLGFMSQVYDEFK